MTTIILNHWRCDNNHPKPLEVWLQSSKPLEVWLQPSKLLEVYLEQESRTKETSLCFFSFLQVWSSSGSQHSISGLNSWTTNAGTQLLHFHQTAPISSGEIVRAREPGRMLRDCPRHVRSTPLKSHLQGFLNISWTTDMLKWMRGRGSTPHKTYRQLRNAESGEALREEQCQMASPENLQTIPQYRLSWLYLSI